ncbi:MAG: hypothetical protein JEZ04_16765 [Spirochaetales bacterium]|nr:hypothetical protein [Spirochaetales bacterium]
MNSNLNDLDFKLSLDYISSRIGMELPLTNYNIVRNYLSAKLNEKSLDFSGYLKMIDSDKSEYNKFVDTVTINETYFFREEKHFTLLNDIVFPALADKQKSVNIWSAACSTGEEAISLYLTAENFFGDNCSFKVSGSDVNVEVLAHFERGVYRSNSFREDGLKYHALVKKNSVVKDKSFRIKPELIKEINKLNLNLSDFNGGVFGELFDVIFLRNTIIYFALEKRKIIIDSVVEKLKPGGFLFLSATEMPLISHMDLNLIETNGSFYFQKKSIAEKLEQNKIIPSILLKLQEEGVTEACNNLETITEEIDLDLILEYAAAKLNNRIFNLVRNPNYDSAVKLIRIIYMINNNEIDRAVLEIDEFEMMTGLNALTLFLKGYTFFIKNKKDQASEYFNKSLMMDSTLWPAGFYLSSILMERKSAEAKEVLKKCITAIKEYIRKDSYKYQIFLEGFNGKYFLRICEQWLKKI